MKQETKNIIINILITVLGIGIVAGLSTLFTNTNTSWYLSLRKPLELIPEFVFPIIWSIIYIIAGLFIFFSLQNHTLNRTLTILLIINGILNILWCLVFFTLSQLLIGLIVIVINLICAYLLVSEMLKDNKLFGYMLVIYPVWLSLATCLNLALWILN